MNIGCTAIESGIRSGDMLVNLRETGLSSVIKERRDEKREELNWRVFLVAFLRGCMTGVNQFPAIHPRREEIPDLAIPERRQRAEIEASKEFSGYSL
jgi:hypothetical protein